MLVDSDCDTPLLHPLVDDRPCPIVQYVDDTLVLVPCGGRTSAAPQAASRLVPRRHWPGNQLPQEHFRPYPCHRPAHYRASRHSRLPHRRVSTKLPGAPSLRQEAPDKATTVLDALAVRVERCIPSWWVHLLNRGGRLTLVNSVLSV
ncbi:unnamed protein product [Urochloa humidicola]